LREGQNKLAVAIAGTKRQECGEARNRRRHTKDIGSCHAWFPTAPTTFGNNQSFHALRNAVTLPPSVTNAVGTSVGNNGSRARAIPFVASPGTSQPWMVFRSACWHLVRLAGLLV
jgi:hypothetical protein